MYDILVPLLVNYITKQEQKNRENRWILDDEACNKRPAGITASKKPAGNEQRQRSKSIFYRNVVCYLKNIFINESRMLSFFSSSLFLLFITSVPFEIWLL